MYENLSMRKTKPRISNEIKFPTRSYTAKTMMERNLENFMSPKTGSKRRLATLLHEAAQNSVIQRFSITSKRSNRTGVKLRSQGLNLAHTHSHSERLKP